MRPGPLRQAVGAVGLVALVPTALLLATGGLGGRDAAVRAVVTLLGVVVVGRVVGASLHAAASRLEAEQAAADPPPRTSGPAAAAGAQPTSEGDRAAPRRRAGDADDDVAPSAPLGA